MAYTIRLAHPADAAALQGIYDYYVQRTTATFDVTTPSVAEFEATMRQILTRYPYLVAEQDGQIMGYAYAHAFKERTAYDWTVECTVYLKDGASGEGRGAELYRILERELQRQHVLTMAACVTSENRASILFHEARGFIKTAEFNNVAFKEKHWLGVTWLTKQIAPLPEEPQAFVPYPTLEKMHGELIR